MVAYCLKLRHFILLDFPFANGVTFALAQVRIRTLTNIHTHLLTIKVLSSYAGQLLLETPSTVAKAPDGNGGVFLALQKSGMLDVLVQEGGCFVFVWGVT